MNSRFLSFINRMAPDSLRAGLKVPAFIYFTDELVKKTHVCLQSEEHKQCMSRD